MAKQEMDMHALRDFAAAWRHGERQEETDLMRAALEKHGKKALELALQAPDLLLFMADQALISKGDIDKVLMELDWTADPAVTGRLLTYKKNPPESAPAPKEKKAPAPSPRDDWTTEKLPDGTWKLKSYKGKDTVVHIPEILGKAQVTHLGRSLFYPYAQGVDEAREALRKTIEKVIIPYGVTEIEEGEFTKGGTFCGCTGLKSVEIPVSVTFIGANAFEYCENLTDIVLPERTMHIGVQAFSHCRSLAAIVIPKGVVRIKHLTFQGCKKLSSVTLSESLLELGNQAFDGCSSLKEIHLPNNLKTIGSWAFENCSSLEKVTIPRSVTSIGRGTFNGCPKLTIYAPAGSYAEQYAKENNIPFVAEEK